MKNLCKFTVKSPAASYIPLPRFLLLDEELQGISNDANAIILTKSEARNAGKPNSTE